MLLNKEILIGIYDYTPANIIWTGLGSNNNWSTNANWNLKAPVPYDILQFAGTTRLTPFNNLTIDTPYNGITFNAGAAGFQLNGNRFVLNSDSITNNSSNIQQINADIVLGSNAGSINCNTANILLRGNISGSVNLTKLGAQTLSLSGNNSYTGNTYVSAGIISILNNNALGTGSVYCSSGSGAISVSVNAAPINTVINNPIFIDGQRPGSGSTIQANKSATFNGLIAVGPLSSTVNRLNVQNGAIMTINGGVSGLPTMNTIMVMNGTGTYILSSIPIIFDNLGATAIYCDTGNETVIIAVSGNKFQAVRPSNLRTDVPFAINNDSVLLGTSNRPARVNLNGNDQIFKNIQTASQSSTLSQISANNIFNDSSTFANLTTNNVSNTTYTGSISGNINLIKTGTSTLTLSGSTALGVGPRYTGFTAISAGTLTNYALSSNPSNKVNFASFTNTALTVDFLTPPTIGNSFVLLPGITINSYPAITLTNAGGRTGSYNSSTSTLSITS